MEKSGKRTRILVATGAATVFLAVVAGAVFVAMGGPLREMFEDSVSTNTMGKNQAALSAGIYGGEAPIGSSRYVMAPHAEPVNQLGAGGTTIPNGKPYDLTFFENYGSNPFVSTEDECFSTFGMDVDNASYTIARRFIEDGHLPEKDAVRTEEFINYFAQDYAQTDGAFTISVDGAKSRFGGPRYHLVRVGIATNEISAADRPSANIVFVVDVSGSMQREDRLGLVKKSLRRLVDELKAGDEIGLVVYGSEGRVLSELTSERGELLAAVEALRSEGSTNAEEGLRLAYEMARRGFESGKLNRIILMSDGVANVGNTDANEILRQVKSDAGKGIFLTCLGFGMGNYNDIMMEKLANHGDGNYHYIDTPEEAERLFGNGATAMLHVVASDAKIQVEFNPQVVDRYRLLGYENRALRTEDFRNDAVDAGEVGAGQTVTALYEVRLKDEALGRPSSEIGAVRIRYLDLNSREVLELTRPVRIAEVDREFESASPRFRLTASVAEFAEILRKSYWAKDGSIASVLETAEDAVTAGASGEKESEFLGLVRKAAKLSNS